MATAHELVLTESKTLRAQYRDRTDALEKVGALIMLPDTVHATVEMVAGYFQVPAKTIDSVIQRNRDELESNGLRTLRDADLQEFKDTFREHLSSAVLRSARLTLLPRPAILNIGQLLTESSVARTVRQYLLTVEATATAGHRETAVRLIRLQERQDYQNILHSLKQGGAVAEEYQLVQNTLYLGLFGMTAADIRRTQPQRTGERYKRDPDRLKPSKSAKDYMTEQQLTLLDNAVLATVAQIRLWHPRGATAAQMIAAINRAVALILPRRIGA